MTPSRIEKRRNGLMQEIVDHTEAELLESGISQEAAQQAASKVAERLAGLFGGQIISFPLNYQQKLRERDEQLLSEFNGTNFGELALRYGMHERNIRKVIAKAAQSSSPLPASHLDKLKERNQKLLSEFNGLNFAELAQRYGLSENTIRHMVTKAKPNQVSATEPCPPQP